MYPLCPVTKTFTGVAPQSAPTLDSPRELVGPDTLSPDGSEIFAEPPKDQTRQDRSDGGSDKDRPAVLLHVGKVDSVPARPPRLSSRFGHERVSRQALGRVRILGVIRNPLESEDRRDREAPSCSP